MAVDITLRWRGALDADASTDYKIQSDKAVAGTFADVATPDATTPFAPVSTTLNGPLTPTGQTVTLTSGASFAANDYVEVERESIKLGTKSTNTFSVSTRGIGASIPQAHADLTPVYKQHESYVDSAVDFGSRHLIRYKVFRVQGTSIGVPTEILVANPTPPPSTDFCTVWGVYQDLINLVQAGISVTIEIAGTDDYVLGTGELIKKASKPTTTDADGYFEFFVPKKIARTGLAAITITVNPGADQHVYALGNVPDADFIHVQRTA